MGIMKECPPGSYLPCKQQCMCRGTRLLSNGLHASISCMGTCSAAEAGAAGNVGNLPMVLVAGLCSDAAGQLLPLRPSADACAEARAWCCASLLC